MNAGRDVERLITTWLTEEATDRSRDRVLESVHRAIERTPQRRFRVAWREPVNLSPMKLAGLAAALVIALLGGAGIGRLTAPDAGGPAASPTPSPIVSPPTVTVESYRAARDEICIRYRPEINPLKPWLDGLYDPELSASDRAERADMLATVAEQTELLIDELSRLAVPAELAAEHGAHLADYDTIVVLIRQELVRLDDGDLAGAEALDLATDAFGDEIEAFETRYRLTACP